MKWHLGPAVPNLGFEPVPMRLRAFVDGGPALDTERGDIRVDGELQTRPVTPWSPPAEQESADAERLEFG